MRQFEREGLSLHFEGATWVGLEGEFVRNEWRGHEGGEGVERICDVPDIISFTGKKAEADI